MIGQRRWIVRTGVEARRDLVGGSRSIPAAGADGSASRRRLAERHPDAGSSVRIGDSVDDEPRVSAPRRHCRH